MTEALAVKVGLTEKVNGLRKVWGEEDIDRVLLWCWQYAEIESGHLQLHEGCNDKEYEKRVASLAGERTNETIDGLIDMTRLSKIELSKRLERNVNYDELKDVMASMKLKFKFICVENYEALIHQRHYEDGNNETRLEDIFK